MWMATLTLTAIGTSTGVVIPKDMLDRLKVNKGDSLYAFETPEGYLLTASESVLEEQLTAGRQLMKHYRDTFRALAE